MKDGLFELLMDLFESRLAELQESHQDELNPENEHIQINDQNVEIKILGSAKEQSTRVFTYSEQVKLTKASYQFLKRMRLLGIINADIFELIMNQLEFSESNVVTLQETKWTIRTVLSTLLNEGQLAFLDLVLYHKEDELVAH